MFTYKRINVPFWSNHDRRFIQKHPDAFDVRRPKTIPYVRDGQRMAERHRMRRHVKEMDHIMHEVKMSHSQLKRIVGPSKLRLEIKAGSSIGAADSESPIDFSPVRTRPYIRASPATREITMIRRSRKGGFEVYALPEHNDIRDEAIPPEGDRTLWESLFGMYRLPKVKLSGEEKALEKRGCWRDGRLVGVVEDEVFPGWGENWMEEDKFADDVSAVEDTLSSSTADAESDAMDIDVPSATPRLKRLREDEDGSEEEGGGTMSAMKKPRLT